jgi:hypothetical protein
MAEDRERALNASVGPGNQRMSERLLSTMAVVVSSVDEGKAYLDFFMPFVADVLKRWPHGQPVAPRQLSDALRSGWCFPSVPAAVSKVLLQRAQKEGLVSNITRKYFPNHKQLASLQDLAAKKQHMLGEVSALAQSLIRYAWQTHGLDWDEQKANTVLERITEDFGADLATAKREGGLGPGPDPDRNESLAVAYGFARHAMMWDPKNFSRIVSMVQGTMIVNAIYFEDIRKAPNRLTGLRAFLDTPVLLQGLGFASPDVAVATREMLALMRTFQIPMCAFSHTFDEMTAVLKTVAASLKQGTQSAEYSGRLNTRTRETLDAVIAGEMTSGDVLMVIANLDRSLEELGVRRIEVSREGQVGRLDEERLASILRERVHYRSKGALERDVESLAAIDWIRGNTRPRDLAQARALFVTSNDALAGASRAFFRAMKRDAMIPHCMSDVALTAQLWVTSSKRKPDLPKRLLIADCYSALAPSQELWERWVRHIITLRVREQLSEEQFQTLIYHQQIKALLCEVVRGDPGKVNDTAVAEVLARYEQELYAPAERAAREAQDAQARAEQETRDAQAQATRERAERRRLTSALLERDRFEARRAANRLRIRAASGFLATLPIATLFAVLVATDSIHGKVWWATSVTLLVFTCACTACWGLRKGWKAPLGVLVSVGALSTLWANVFGVAGDSLSKTKSTRGGVTSTLTTTPAGQRHGPERR